MTPKDLSDTCYNINYEFAINAVINSKRDSVGRVALSEMFSNVNRETVYILDRAFTL